MKRGTKKKCGYTNPNNKHSRNLVLSHQYGKHGAQKHLKKAHQNNQKQIELKESKNFQIEICWNIKENKQTYKNTQILNREDDFERNNQQYEGIQQLIVQNQERQICRLQLKKKQQKNSKKKDQRSQQEQLKPELKEQQKKQKSGQSSNIGAGSIGRTDQFVDYDQTHVPSSSKQSKKHSFEKNITPSSSQAPTFLSKNQNKIQIYSEVSSNDKKSDENLGEQHLKQQQLYSKFYNSTKITLNAQQNQENQQEGQNIKSIQREKFKSSSFHVPIKQQKQNSVSIQKQQSVQKQNDQQKCDSDQFWILKQDEDMSCLNTNNKMQEYSNEISSKVQQSQAPKQLKIIQQELNESENSRK